MEGEGGADSGAPPAPPRPPLAYEHLAFFEETRCIQPEHELALKQHLYNRPSGIAHLSNLRGFSSQIEKGTKYNKKNPNKMSYRNFMDHGSTSRAS